MTFADRIYDVDDGSQIKLSISEPEAGHDGLWLSELRIDWPSGRVTRLPAHGVDKIDALLSAIALARINLTHSQEVSGRQLTWLGGPEVSLEVHIPK